MKMASCYLVETKAPNGYELDETKHPISFAGKADYTLTYRVKNKQQVQIGSIKIVKQDKESKKRLTGAEFKFRDTTNNYTATFTANRNGEVLIPGLAGDRVYEVTEIKAPNGYIIDRRVHKARWIYETTFNRRRISVERYGDRKNRNSDSWNRWNHHNSQLIRQSYV